MKTKMLLITVIALIFCSSALANTHVEINHGTNIPVIVEALSWGEGEFLIFYYPEQHLLVFMGSESLVRVSIENFSQTYQDLVYKKVKASQK